MTLRSSQLVRGSRRPRAFARAASRAPGASSGPSTRPAKPMATRSPPIGASATRRVPPGSKRTEEPAGHGQVHAVGGGPVEAQPRVDLEEVEVRGDRDRHGGGVGHLELDRSAGGAPPGRGSSGQRGAGAVQRAGPERLATTASRVPSSKTASTCTSVHARPRPAARPRPRARATGLDRLGQPGAVPGRLADGVGDQRVGLGDVQPQAAGPAGAGQLGRGEDQQPIPLGRCQSHEPSAPHPARPGQRLDRALL